MSRTALPSRKYQNPDAFAVDFMKSLTPGIIPRSKFIDWNNISKKLEILRPQIEFYIALAERVHEKADFKTDLADSLLATDDPLPLLKCAFELLGHTGAEFVTKEDDIMLRSLASDISNGNEERAEYVSSLLQEVGFLSILETKELADLLLGVQVGLETHRRKNIGGEAFKVEVEKILKKICSELDSKQCPVEFDSEVSIKTGTQLSKKVDFAIKFAGKLRFGVEVNFYTVSGSKPSEIKRSYGDILGRLKTIGVDLIWVTDGKGYRSMERSLRDAFFIMPNIYNLRHLERHLLKDLQTVM